MISGSRFVTAPGIFIFETGKKIAWLNLIFLISLPSLGNAQLVWKNRNLVAHMTPDLEQVTSSFPFTNEGKQSVTIRGVKSSCDCTVASLAKKTYQPGESGSIDVVMKKGTRQGTQRSTIRVFTDDPRSDADLMWMVTLEDWVTISPRFALWKQKGPSDARQLNLNFSSPEVNLVSANCPDKNFKISQVTEEGKIRVQVEPKSTQEAASAVVNIQIKLPDGKTQLFQIPAIIK